MDVASVTHSLRITYCIEQPSLILILPFRIIMLWLAAAVEAAGLMETLSGPGTFTVFAPTESAFDNLPSELLEKLQLPVWQPQLKDVSDLM